MNAIHNKDRYAASIICWWWPFKNYLARAAACMSLSTFLTMCFLASCHSSLPIADVPLYRSCVANFASALYSVIVIFFC